jgi:translocation and assembly module TamB
MTTEKRTYPLWLKILLGIAGFMVLLVVAVFIFIRTETFRNLVRDEIVSAASESLNGTLSIGSLEGDFFSNISVLDLRLMSGRETIVHLPRLEIQFSL